MIFERILLAGLAMTLTAVACSRETRPDDVVSLAALIPDIVIDLRYFSDNNFMGTPVDGYEANVALMMEEAALALKQVQDDLKEQGLGLKVFDAYRPQRAVDHFVRWAGDPDDLAMKTEYYPHLDKAEIIPQGYIAMRSSHSRGSTADLTLVSLATGEELDMGSHFDFFDPVSWPEDRSVTQQQYENRMLLRDVMEVHGFVPLREEWWHFTYSEEPYPDTYFDFPVR